MFNIPEMKGERFAGMNVYVNEHLPEETEVRVKRHFFKPGMKRSYHKRVDKKWAKRYGYKTDRYLLETEYGYFLHPNTLKLLKEKINGGK